MKTILIFLFGLLLTIGANAQQDEDAEVQQADPRAQQKINSLRIAFITDKLELTPEQAEKFWPIYREFALKRMDIRSELRRAARDIDKDNPDPKKQQELVDLSLKVKQRVLDLEKEYSEKFLKVVTAEQMLKLPAAELEFRGYLRDLLQQRRQNGGRPQRRN